MIVRVRFIEASSPTLHPVRRNLAPNRRRDHDEGDMFFNALLSQFALAQFSA
jgi:hypothetical protein